MVGDKRKDFLDVLLEFEGNGKDEPDKISERNVNIFILEMFMAGTETTSSTIEYALTELICNPESMTKAKAELASVIGANRNVEESDIDNLPFLQAVIKETLRLHPPIPFLIPRRAIQDTKFMGYHIPKNTQVLVNAWAIGRDPDVWDNPLRFNPERFIVSKVDYKGQNYEFIPFGAGRRMCAGVSLGHRVLHLVLGTILHQFDWELESNINPADLDMRDRLGITMRKLEPLRAVPTKMPRRISSSRGRGRGRQDTMSQPMQSLRDEQNEDQSIGHEPLQLPVDTQVSPTPLQLGGQVAASSSSSVRTRGPNLGQPTPVNPTNRQMIRLRGLVFLDISVSRSITNDIKMHFTAPWKTWAEIPIKIKDELFGKFQGRYMWDETEEQNVRLAWDKLGKDRFRDILNRARNEMLVKHKKSDIAYLHNLGPNWMKAEVWNELVAYWSSPEWRKKSQSAKINRMTVKDGSITKHACGSIKIEIHEDRLEDYASAIVEKYGSNSESPPIFDMDKWIEVSGGFNKGRVYGFGSSAKSQTSGSSTSQSCTSAYPGSSSQPAMTQEEIQQLIDEKASQMRAEMMAEILDQVRKELKTTGGTQFATSSHPTTSDSTNP
ncbi:hypothetical protein GH714_038633 [Hevea brasiliensis]|uniref:Cytochrome P450 n=1 Tax=Hevea brasiliensis TaxID=3981 RepID=A0A6A6KLG0_HEVBR|nr:hypothetical protein GH714_038633 [Hevea brasiliensis]